MAERGAVADDGGENGSGGEAEAQKIRQDREDLAKSFLQLRLRPCCEGVHPRPALNGNSSLNLGLVAILRATFKGGKDCTKRPAERHAQSLRHAAFFVGR